MTSFTLLPCWKISWQNQGYLKTDLTTKTEHVKFTVWRQFFEGHRSEKPHHPEITHGYFKAICNESIDTIINLIQDKFEQPGFKVFGQVEQLFLKSVNKEDHSDEITTVESTFRGDYDHDLLITERQLLPALFDDCEPVNFGDIVKDI